MHTKGRWRRGPSGQLPRQSGAPNVSGETTARLVLGAEGRTRRSVWSREDPHRAANAFLGPGLTMAPPRPSAERRRFRSCLTFSSPPLPILAPQKPAPRGKLGLLARKG